MLATWGWGARVSGRGVRLTEEQRLDWLRLIRSDNVGPRGIMAQTPQAGHPTKPYIAVLGDRDEGRFIE